MAENAPGSVGSSDHRMRGRRERHALGITKARLRKAALKLAAYLLGAYVVLRLIPGLEEALANLAHVSWLWVLGALALETLSEIGFVGSWRAIVDPQSLLDRNGHSRRMDTHVAWAQLGGGTVIPGGSLGGVGVGAWLLHRFGMPNELVAEREFNLSFLNTAVDALALIVFGLLLAAGIVPGAQDLALTLLPAVLAAGGVAVALLIARRARAGAPRISRAHPKLGAALTTLSEAVQDTRRLLVGHRAPKALLGALAYLGFDVLVLWTAFLAIGQHPIPGLAVVLMAYIIGALGGSLPLPAGIGTVGGIVGTLILYGVAHDAAVAAVLLYQAIGMLVPVIGGGIAYLLVRRALVSGMPVAEGHAGPQIDVNPR